VEAEPPSITNFGDMWPVRSSRYSKEPRESKADKVEPTDTEEWSNDDREKGKPGATGRLPCLLRNMYGYVR